MPRTAALDLLSAAVDSTALTDRHPAGALAAVRVPDFLAPDTCRAVMAALDRRPAADHDPARVPTRIVRCGPALNACRDQDGGLDPGPVPARRGGCPGGLAEDRDAPGRVDLTPQPGDGLLCDPANFHAVAPDPTGRRTVLAFLLGRTTTGRLIARS
ncbi:hypothetical protein [Kitasatospora sp. NPDC093102]|uniref:hypothetical protein n=1 Tax=Kitasatospora sp. NPDC093102 TaxID=3155069 RepID=UPI00341BDD9A